MKSITSALVFFSILGAAVSIAGDKVPGPIAQKGELLFEDDGVGFNTETANYGMGIRNVQSRVEYLNGTLSIDSEVGVGTTFEMNFPLIAENH